MAVVLLFAIQSFFVGCKDVIVNNTGGVLPCPLPKEQLNGSYYSPTYATTKMRLSPSGTKLLYKQMYSSRLYMLDLQTMQTTTYNLSSLVDSVYNDIGPISFEWCPYDETKILINGGGLIDIDGKGYRKFRHNLLLLTTLPTPTISIVSPKIWGKYGSESGVYLLSWLSNSINGDDKFLIGYSDPDSYGFESSMVFNLQMNTHEVSPVHQTGYLSTVRENKLSGNTTWYSTMGKNKYLGFMGREYQYPTLSICTWLSISPNGKKVAVSILPVSDSINGTFTRIWIFDVDSIQANPTIKPTYTELDLRKLFCKYAFGGVWAEYITDSTLAITMHSDQDVISPMWEITDKGKLIRQLVEK
ncbi:MAG: hypothetical protein K1X91_14910 [Bacteriodetes bacterium]|nr:hypothetical protein [Bacteroidota bacterium]